MFEWRSANLAGKIRSSALVAAMALASPFAPAAGAEIAGPGGEVVFQEDFESGTSRWVFEDSRAFKLTDAGDGIHGTALELTPFGLTYALIRGSGDWGDVRIEGEFYFPTDNNAYLGLVYNFAPSGERTDFGSIYIKGNGSYLRANPWRDGNASRLLYEEYRTALTGKDAVVPLAWQRFAAEIVGNVAHFYVGDMETPKMVFPLYERESGLIGFKPRVAGFPVWIDNIVIRKIEAFSYTGPRVPDIAYHPDELITEWQVIGPLPGPSEAVERAVSAGETIVDEMFGELRWRPFSTDDRGAVITGRVTEYAGTKPVAYFRTTIEAPAAGRTTLHFSSTDEIALFVNGRFYSFVYRQGYVSGAGLRWNAWHDFWKNPDHGGRRISIPVEAGENRIVVRVRNGQFASGGFFVREEPAE